VTYPAVPCLLGQPHPGLSPPQSSPVSAPRSFPTPLLLSAPPPSTLSRLPRPPRPPHLSPPSFYSHSLLAYRSAPASARPSLSGRFPPCASCSGADGAASANRHAGGVGPVSHHHRGCPEAARAKGHSRLSGDGGAQVGASHLRRRQRRYVPKPRKRAKYVVLVYSTDFTNQHSYVGPPDDGRRCLLGARLPAAPDLAAPFRPGGGNGAHGGHAGGPPRTVAPPP